MTAVAEYAPPIDLDRYAPRVAIEFNAFQERILAVFLAGVREVWAIKGNRAGGTTFGAMWMNGGVLSDDPDDVSWVCCESSKVQRESTQPAITSLLAPHEIRRDRHGREEINKYSGKIDLLATTGGKIQFRNYEDGSRSAVGSSIPRAWCDEFIGGRDSDLDYYHEVRRAVVDTGGRILATLTAVKGLTPLLKHVFEDREPVVVPVGTTPAEAARLVAGHSIAIVYGSMWENEKNLPPGAIEEYAASLADEWERAVRIEGRVLPLGGRPYVSGEVLSRIAVAEPLRREALGTLAVEVYEEPAAEDPVTRAPAATAYALGVDAAYGVGRDRGAIVGLRVGVGEPHRDVVVAVGDETPGDLGEAVVALAARYRGAWVMPEANGPGLVVIERLRGRARVLPRPGSPDRPPHGEAPLGYVTGARSRDALLDGMRTALRDGRLVIRSATLRDALGTFVWGDRRPEAAQGFFDDAVFALALALYAAEHAPAARPARREALPLDTPAVHFAEIRRARQVGMYA